jgi:putative heme-binding domain-containing protein
MHWRRKNRKIRSKAVSPHRTSCAAGNAAAVALVWAFAAIGPNGASAGEEAAASKAKEQFATSAVSKKAESQKPVARVRWTTSHVVGSPEPPYAYVFRRAFPGLKFDKPVYMIPEPGTDRIFMLQYPNGLVFAIRDDPKTTESKQILKFPVGKEESCECLSIIFHPNYLKNRQVFIFANVKRREGANGQRQERDQIWRFHVAATPPYAIVPESGEKIIEWPSAGHDGGDMGFGPDGYLYITAGDGTTGSDPDITGQDITDLRASMLRIDVDHPALGKPYGVPKDNPFLHIPKARPEIWAFGLRAPWRMSFDPATGNLWVGDVGQDLWEMIHLVRRGGNYGWSVMEGSHPFYPERKIGPAPISPPIVEHHHSEARSITGGFVYHGKRLPELANHYLYCCYQTGTVWGFRYENGKVLDHRVLADSTYNCATWGRDHANELYLVALSGEILQLDPNPRAKVGASKFPELLSQTGIFESVPEQKPAPGVIPYSVNAPVWHDGASLTQLLGVPNDDTINPGVSRGWEFMDGAAAVQTLSLEMERGNAASRKVIETRLMTRQGGEWAGYSYEWNDEQTDARLVSKQGKDRKFLIRDTAAPGGTRQQTWRFLSRAECMVCHSRAANFALGLSTLQMNRPHESAPAENQLTLLQRAGYLKPPLSSPPEKLPRLVNPYDQAAALEPRVRSYLHANCSQCHVADGGGNARMELEFTTARDKMGVIGVVPLQGKFEIPEAEIIAPADPFRSVMLYRLSKLGGGRMPQVGSSVVDRAAVKLFHDWIVSLPARDEKNPARSHLAEQRQREEKSLASLRSASSSPPPHDPALDHLLGSTSGSMRLAHAVDQRKLHPTVESKAIASGSAHPSPAVRDLFERFLPEEQRVRRLGTSIDVHALLAIPGNIERGRDLYFKNSTLICQNCHQIEGKGRKVGPELSHIGKKYNKGQILENLLDPSKVIEEKYVAYVIQTRDGKTRTGLVLERGADAVTLIDAQGNSERILFKNIEAFEPQRKSLMPDNLLRDLTAEQAADLLAYLESLK